MPRGSCSGPARAGRGRWLMLGALALALAACASPNTSLGPPASPPPATASPRPATAAPQPSPQPMGLSLGDGKISSRPAVGSVFSCQTRFPPNGPGADLDGPWIHGQFWDPAAKPTVDGDVAWPNATITVTIEGNERVVRANGLPRHHTGAFPIAVSDDAFAYDRNPNAIRPQQVLLRLPVMPQVAAQPSCVPMGMIGYALTGAQIFNALDARGRDAAAHEIQDRCDGHPEQTGAYHYHSLSRCAADASGRAGRHSDLVGYALDGFGIFGRRNASGAPVTNADLDACHGHTERVRWDGAMVTMYHYHFTAEYPYSVGCFAGRPAS